MQGLFGKSQLLGAAFLALAACGEVDQQTNEAVLSADARTAQLTSDFYARDRVRPGGAQATNDVFVAPEQINLKPSDRLPRSVQGAESVLLLSRDPMSLTQVASRLTEITKIQHSVELGLNNSFVAGGQTEGEDDEPIPTAAGTPVAPIQSTSAQVTIRPNLRGPLSEVLDKVASAFEVEWTYTDGRIVFREFVTRQYQLSALPQAGEGGGVNLWDGMIEGLTAVAGDGSRVLASPATGILTVRANLSSQARIAEYVASMNRTLGQQIAFDVNVLTVDISDEEGVGVDLTAVLSGRLPVNWNAGSAVPEAVGSVNIGVVEAGNLDLTAAISALSRQGRVAVETRTGATTTNFQIIPIEVVDETAYVSSTSTEEDDNGDRTTTVTASTVTTGFELQLQPRILNTREVLLRYTLSLSSLNSLESFGDDESGVQLPEISRTKFEQQVVLRNNQTLVLAGFERRRADASAEGVGNARFMGLGGRRQAELNRVTSVVFITPRILTR
jgi:type II secretory pathway component GspD/PulD (secretin)